MFFFLEWAGSLISNSFGLSTPRSFLKKKKKKLLVVKSGEWDPTRIPSPFCELGLALGGA